MDINAIVEQLTGMVEQVPGMAEQLSADPAGMVEQVTGLSLGETELAQVVEGVTSQLGANGFDLASLTEESGLSGLAEQVAGVDLGSLGDQVSGLLGEESPLGNIGGFLGGLFGK